MRSVIQRGVLLSREIGSQQQRCARQMLSRSQARVQQKGFATKITSRTTRIGLANQNMFGQNPRMPVKSRNMSTSKGAAAGSSSKGKDTNWIIEGTESNINELFTNSSKVPLIIDLYADWCAPCKQLTPKLEARVKAAKGKMLLVKINVDKEQNIAASLRVQSLPTVIGVFDKKVVSQLVGAVPDKEIDVFFKKVSDSVGTLKGGEDDSDGSDEDIEDDTETVMLQDARDLLEQNDIPGAAELFSHVLGATASSNARKVEAITGLIHCALAEQNVDAAKSLVSTLTSTYASDLKADPDALKAVASVELVLEARKTGGDLSSSDIVLQMEKDPSNLDLALSLSAALFAEAKPDMAIENALTLLKRDPSHPPPLTLFNKYFESVGQEHPLVVSTRRRLANILWV